MLERSLVRCLLVLDEDIDDGLVPEENISTACGDLVVLIVLLVSTARIVTLCKEVYPIPAQRNVERSKEGTNTILSSVMVSRPGV